MSRKSSCCTRVICCLVVLFLSVVGNPPRNQKVPLGGLEKGGKTGQEHEAAERSSQVGRALSDPGDGRGGRRDDRDGRVRRRDAGRGDERCGAGAGGLDSSGGRVLTTEHARTANDDAAAGGRGCRRGGFGCGRGSGSGAGSRRCHAGGLGHQAARHTVGGGASLEVHRIRAAPRLASLVGGAVVASVARVSGQVRAAGLASKRVEAVDLLVRRRASCVAVSASILASGARAAHGLRRLVTRGILTATDGEQLASRHLHELGLIGLRLGGDVEGEGEGRQRGDGLCEHFGGGKNEVCFGQCLGNTVENKGSLVV